MFSWAIADDGRLMPIPAIRLGSICRGGVIVYTKAGMPRLMALAKPMPAAPMTIIMMRARNMPPSIPATIAGPASFFATADARPDWLCPIVRCWDPCVLMESLLS